MADVITIYMALLDEGVDCWRPVEAEPCDPGYRVLGPVPDEEIWEFAPGSIVVCQQRKFEDGTQGLVAVGLLN